jgi:hypothetical protein
MLLNVNKISLTYEPFVAETHIFSIFIFSVHILTICIAELLTRKSSSQTANFFWPPKIVFLVISCRVCWRMEYPILAGIMTLRIKTFSITTLSVATLSITMLSMTINQRNTQDITQHNNIQYLVLLYCASLC